MHKWLENLMSFSVILLTVSYTMDKIGTINHLLNYQKNVSIYFFFALGISVRFQGIKLTLSIRNIALNHLMPFHVRENMHYVHEFDRENNLWYDKELSITWYSTKTKYEYYSHSHRQPYFRIGNRK